MWLMAEEARFLSRPWISLKTGPDPSKDLSLHVARWGTRRRILADLDTRPPRQHARLSICCQQNRQPGADLAWTSADEPEAGHISRNGIKTYKKEKRKISLSNNNLRCLIPCSVQSLLEYSSCYLPPLFISILLFMDPLVVNPNLHFSCCIYSKNLVSVSTHNVCCLQKFWYRGKLLSLYKPSICFKQLMVNLSS